jgi:pimeloyl-ACP methyl ester carboxylesterase
VVQRKVLWRADESEYLSRTLVTVGMSSGGRIATMLLERYGQRYLCDLVLSALLSTLPRLAACPFMALDTLLGDQRCHAKYRVA